MLDRATLSKPPATSSKPLAAFYFDLASPLCYLTAERILQLLPGPLEWQPVMASEWEAFGPFRCEEEELIAREEIERLARASGLQPLRWPTPMPFDSAIAMRAATYAKSIGRVVPFAQAAFRQAFAGGHTLEGLDFVLIAAAACEMHPRAVIQATESPKVAERLAAASAAASRQGVRELPAIRLAGRLYSGEHVLEQALAA
jgi:2-hydroxychromene-2-carboxylate isomerase